jgi:UrcA family protein
MKITKTSAQNRINIRAAVLSVLATVCVAAAAPSVRAGTLFLDVDPPATTVGYGDLNLANSQGVEILYRRLSVAAQHVCRALDGRSLEQQARFSTCTRESVARAVAAVDHPALTAFQAIKTGQHDGIAKLAKR